MPDIFAGCCRRFYRTTFSAQRKYFSQNGIYSDVHTYLCTRGATIAWFYSRPPGYTLPNMIPPCHVRPKTFSSKIRQRGVQNSYCYVCLRNYVHSKIFFAVTNKTWPAKLRDVSCPLIRKRIEKRKTTADNSPHSMFTRMHGMRVS